MKKVYCVILKARCDEGEDFQIRCYDSFEKALCAFELNCKDELDPNISWVGDYIDNNFNIRPEWSQADVAVEKTDRYFEVTRFSDGGYVCWSVSEQEIL